VPIADIHTNDTDKRTSLRPPSSSQPTSVPTATKPTLIMANLSTPSGTSDSVIRDSINLRVVPWDLPPLPTGSKQLLTTLISSRYIDQDVLKASGVTEPYYCPVDDSQGFWQFSSATATVNGHIIDRSSNSAIADTGTTLALVSDDLCEQIYAAIPGAKKDKFQQGWVFPLSVPIEKLPTVQFAVGSKLFTVLGEDLQYAPTGDGFYYGGIQSRGDLPFDILGDTFLKNVYAIFDQGNKRFGCVQRIEPESKKVSSSPSGGQGTLGSSGAGLKDWFGKWLESLWKLLGFR